MKSTASISQTVSDPVSRYARLGLWALPAFVLLLNVGNITHQPPPQTRFGDWSLYVTTTEFLLSHLFATIGGQVFAVFGFMAFGVVFMQRGSVRLGGSPACRLCSAGWGLALSRSTFREPGLLACLILGFGRPAHRDHLHGGRQSRPGPIAAPLPAK